MHFSA
jgi:hypothetical protein